MLGFGGPDLFGLFRRVWRVLDDWQNVLVVPVPKRRNLNICDNWCGISLMNVLVSCWVGFFKSDYRLLLRVCCLIVSVVQSCVDIIFVARQLVEKVRGTQWSSVYTLH